MLHCFKSPLEKEIIVHDILTAARRALRKQSKFNEQLLAVAAILIKEVLTEAQQKQLYMILLDLPPAVLGDIDAQTQSRVFVDAKADARHAIVELKHSYEEQSASVSVIETPISPAV